MSVSGTQSSNKPAPTPEEAAGLIRNADANANVQRNGVVQGVEKVGTAYQAKSNALIAIANKARDFIDAEGHAFLHDTVDAQIKDVSARADAGEGAVRQIQGGLTTFMLKTSAPHDPTTVPYEVSSDIARNLGDKFMAAKAGMAATVAATSAPKKNIPPVSVPAGGAPVPPPAQEPPSEAPAGGQAPAGEQPAPAQAEAAEKPAPTAEGTHEAQPAATSAEVVKVEGGQPAERKEAPGQA